jgi:NAD+ kinase
MVLATPVGSTAYNLSNGGPVMAWGVEGTVVSFVAPHTLAARPLVVAPRDIVEVQHMGRGAPLKVLADGVQVGRLQPGEVLRVKRGGLRATLAFVDDTSFYARYRDNFAVPMTFPGPRVRSSEAGEP